jgi:hypothetical protein
MLRRTLSRDKVSKSHRVGNNFSDLNWLIDLVLAPSLPSSSHILSWPHNTELFDSYIKALTFNNTGFVLLHLFFPYENLNPALVKQLADLDFRKQLLSQPFIFPDGRISRSTNLGLPSLTKFVRGSGSGTMLCCIPPHDFHVFDAERFYQVSMLPFKVVEVCLNYF